MSVDKSIILSKVARTTTVLFYRADKTRRVSRVKIDPSVPGMGADVPRFCGFLYIFLSFPFILPHFEYLFSRFLRYYNNNINNNSEAWVARSSATRRGEEKWVVGPLDPFQLSL